MTATLLEQPLVGAHVSLAPFTTDHVCDRYLGWLNDPDVNRFLEIRWTPQTRQTALAFVRSFEGAPQKRMWGIYAEDGHRLIGTATLYNINPHHRSAEFSLLIGERESRGGQTAADVIRVIARFAFDALRLRRLTGGSYATNYAMNFVFKRLGFRREGVYKEAYQTEPGVYVDGYRWALLDRQWRSAP